MNGADARLAIDHDLERAIHLFLLNRGVLLTPFHNMMLVSPATGESLWYLSTGVGKETFEDTLALFAREVGAGRGRIILLVLDGAGWHIASVG